MTTADHFKKINRAAKDKTEKVKENGLGSMFKRESPVPDASGVPYAYGNRRDAEYTPPGMLKQTFIVYKTQMKRFCRDRAFVILMMMIAVVPIGVFAMGPLELVDTHLSNTYMATALVLAPMTCALVASITCGSMIPQEFNERTAFLSMPLPMTRATFCIGKFLAGFSLALAVLLAAYGFAMVASSSVGEVTYTASFGPSVAVAVMTMFFYCCVTFLISTFMKRSGTMLSLLFLIGILPALIVGLGFAVHADFLGYFPIFGFDLSIMLQGMPALGSVASIHGFLGSTAPFPVGSSVGIMCATALFLGIACLFLAVMKVQRRDM